MTAHLRIIAALIGTAAVSWSVLLWLAYQTMVAMALSVPSTGVM